MTDSILATLREFDGHRDPEVRKNVCVALAAAASREAVERLVEIALQDEQEQVRACAMAELSQLDVSLRRVAWEKMEALFVRGGYSAALADVIQALNQLGNPSKTPWLQSLRLGLRIGWSKGREFFHTDVFRLAFVALWALGFVLLATWWIGSLAGLDIASNVRDRWFVAAMVTAVLVGWLTDRRTTRAGQHFNFASGLLIESLWSALAAAVAGLLLLLVNEDRLELPWVRSLPRLSNEDMGPSPRSYTVDLVLLMALLGFVSRAGAAIGSLRTGRRSLEHWQTWQAATVAVAATFSAAYFWVSSWTMETAPWAPFVIILPSMMAVAVSVAWREAPRAVPAPGPAHWQQGLNLLLLLILGCGAALAMLLLNRAADVRSSIEKPDRTVQATGRPEYKQTFDIDRVPYKILFKGDEGQRLGLELTPDGSSNPDLEVVVRSASGGVGTRPLATLDDPERGCVELTKKGGDLLVTVRVWDEREFSRRATQLSDLVPLTFNEGRKLRKPFQLELRAGSLDQVNGSDGFCNRRRDLLSADFSPTVVRSLPMGELRRGARVWVRKPLAGTAAAETLSWVSDMDQFEGREMVVASVSRDPTPWFRTEDNSWVWSAEWVQRIEPPRAPAATAASGPAFVRRP